MTEKPSGTPAWMPKIVKESGISLVGSVVGTALNYAVLATVTRYLDPEQFGTFAVAQSVVAVSLIFVLCGTPGALDRFIPYYNARNEGGKVRGLLAGTLRLTSWLGLAVVLALLALSRTLSTAVFENDGLLPVLRMMAFSVPALAWIDLVASSFAGFKELRYRVYTHQLALPLLKIAFALPILALGFGLLGWVWAYLASLLAGSLLAWAFFRRHIWASLRRTPPSAVDFKGVVSYSWPLSINQLVLMLSGHVGVLLLGAFRSETDVGAFRVFIYVVLIMTLVKMSFGRIYKPIVTESLSTGDKKGVLEIHQRVSKWMLIAASFTGLTILFLREDILVLLVPSGYVATTSALLVLAASGTIVGSLGPQGMTLEALGNTKFSMVNALLMLSINIGLGFLLIPGYGALGAAIALAIATLAASLAELLEVYALHRIHPFSATYFRGVAVVLCGGTIMYALTSVWETAGFPRAATLTLLLASFFALGLRFSGALDAEDYAVLKHAWARLTAGRRRG
jgi:O-antigen/teichoic acid export membrane protein